MNNTLSLTNDFQKILGQNAKSIFTLPFFKRFEINFSENISCLIDFHPNIKAYVFFFRIKNINGSINIDLSSFGTHHEIAHNLKFNLLLNFENDGDNSLIWIPQIYSQICLDNFQRISLSNKNTPLYSWTWLPNNQLKIKDLVETRGITVIPVVVFEKVEKEFFRKCQSVDGSESRLYLKSNWFYASRPNDIWNYLINGGVYDPRADSTIKKQFKCQQCANAWWNYFGFLFKKTQNKIYDFLQNEIACSVLIGISPQGEWGHGFWSDDLETHSRFHLDGIHLLLSQYEKTGDTVWMDAAEKGMGFVTEFLAEQLADRNIWFLHDTLELKKKPRIKSELLGKSIGNSLCINTHVQTLSVLYRLFNLLPDKQKYVDAFDKGIRALRLVFEHQPGEFIYRFVLEWLTKYNSLKRSPKRSIQVKNAIIHRFLAKIYWPIVRFFPRIIHPSGFIERDLTLSMLSDRYHVINLKDLLTIYHQQPTEWLRPYIIKGMNILRRYVTNKSLADALQRSPYFIETIDIYYLYDKCIERIDNDEFKEIENVISTQTGGYSLDYYVTKE